jgi:hypothetical protein
LPQGSLPTNSELRWLKPQHDSVFVSTNPQTLVFRCWSCTPLSRTPYGQSSFSVYQKNKEVISLVGYRRYCYTTALRVVSNLVIITCAYDPCISREREFPSYLISINSLLAIHLHTVHSHSNLNMLSNSIKTKIGTTPTDYLIQTE